MRVTVTKAGIRTAIAAYLLMGLPLTFMFWIMYKIGGWWPIFQSITVAIFGATVVWLLARRYPPRS